MPLLHHRERNGGLALQAGQGEGFLAASLHLRHVPHHDAASSADHRNGGEKAWRGVTAHHPDQPATPSHVDGAGRQIREGRLDGAHQGDRREPQGDETLGIETDLQFRVAQPHLLHAIDPLHPLQGLAHGARLIAQVFVVRLADHGQRRCGIGVGAGDLQDHRVTGGLWQLFPLRFDLAAQVRHPLVEQPLRDLLEADQDTGDPLPAVGRGELDVGHPSYRILEGIGDPLLHVRGGGPRHHRRDDDPVEVDGGILLAGKLLVGEETHHQNEQEGEVDQDVVAEETFQEIHGRESEASPTRTG